ncbi:MAG: hypothetical protein SVN78_04025 [Deferribacterota bacterium]|nr:hypothetical protein [Deferribacterota bacterium]
MYYNLGLLGYPLRHSISPLIHTYLLYKNFINGGYNCFELQEEASLSEFINFARRYNFAGFNVTLPYKEKIFKYIDEVDSSAKNTHSINTLLIDKGITKAYNTDLFGFSKLIENNNIELLDKNIVVIGSGGVVGTILYYLLNNEIKSLCILCRNVEKGKNLISRLQLKENGSVLVENLNKRLREGINCDILIHATSAGISGEFDMNLNNINFNIAIDLQYSLKDLTPFLQRIKNKNYNIIIDGFDMLIFQAIKSFEIWTKRKFDINLEEISSYLKGST